MEWIGTWISKQRAARRVRNSPYRAALDNLPQGLASSWRHSAPQEYPGIRTDAFFFACAAARCGKPCALPSDAADSVWHAWLRCDPLGLEGFCRRHFGSVVPHVERTGLGEGALLNTFAACHGPARRRLRLPKLFSLDARLRMPGGHGYWMRAGEVVHARVGQQGWGSIRARPHPELAIEALYAADVVDRRCVTAALRRQYVRTRARTLADGGSSCGADLPLFAALADGSSSSDSGCGDSGGGGADSACDSGSSCGSTCGSSCGSSCGGSD